MVVVVVVYSYRYVDGVGGAFWFWFNPLEAGGGRGLYIDGDVCTFGNDGEEFVRLSDGGRVGTIAKIRESKCEERCVVWLNGVLVMGEAEGEGNGMARQMTALSTVGVDGYVLEMDGVDGRVCVYSTVWSMYASLYSNSIACFVVAVPRGILYGAWRFGRMRRCGEGGIVGVVYPAG